MEPRGRGRWRGRGWRPYNRGRGQNSRGRGWRLSPQSTPQPSYAPIEVELSASEVDTVCAKSVDFSPRDGPYSGWKYYFPNEGYQTHSNTSLKLDMLEAYFHDHPEQFLLDRIEEQQFFVVDIKQVGDAVSWPELLDQLREQPEWVISVFGLAMHQVVSTKIHQELDQSAQKLACSAIPYQVPPIRARIVGLETVLPLKQLKANFYDKFVSIRGTVIRVSNVKPLCTQMAFTCYNCSTLQVITQPYGRFTFPTKCLGSGCRSRSFQPVRDSPLTETVDWQTIRIQEVVDEERRESGRVPRAIDSELLQDLVDSCMPGDMITLSGIVKVNNSPESGNMKVSRDKCTFVLYIHANSVASLRNSDSACISPLGLELSLKDLYAIEAIQAEPNLFKLIVASLCPTIYGHEMVKAGLILGLIGGTHKFLDDRNKIPLRGDPHVLVVGDPGLGKSQMLRACSRVAPRGVYVCGTAATSSGLTVTLVREKGSSEYSLEAGALVLSDQGCCCLDEFDKMAAQHPALLEAMEQQSISIAKGGMVCNLPARTSVLAAANPVGGHYDCSKTVSENLKMGSALLSRFDLVFILLDKADEARYQELDLKLSEHVMALHAPQGHQPSSHWPGKSSSLQISQGEELSERLKYKQGEECDPIPHQLLRKYIAYARQYVKPQLSLQAGDILKDFYLTLRKQYQTSDSTPITTRQLESLIRLTEARARLELRVTATQEDAQDIVQLLKFSMSSTYSNEFGVLDFHRSQHGSGMSSSRSCAKRFVAALTRLSEQNCNSIFTLQQLKGIANDLHLQIPDFGGFVASLNNHGFLLKKGPKVYQLQTTDY
ncbi:MCM8 [Cordylochernes scorpioides]|uniref:DNA helicase MCM8 n=1 Tax=Cordylochernes scorpioides TaxID=51811 RepID=A0ABY6KD62_9ARAC|nr:MCM8 [Cordylochernes scorpioides]